MPAFVIYGMDEPVRGASFEREIVRVGRDPSSDIVLAGDTVSREHAEFVRDPAGKWRVRCVSQKNPIVVQGAVVTTEASVLEGTEVLVGSHHSILFSENETTARAYLGGPMIAKRRCAKCNWTGLVSKLQKAPVCPMCGGSKMIVLEGASPVQPAQDTTAQMSEEKAQAFWRKMKEAKHSYLERIGEASMRRRLNDREPLEIGTKSPLAFRLDGITFGSAVVRWDGRHYVAESSMKFPAMKVNGDKTDSATLKHGDTIEIGSNRFKFLTE